MKEHSKKGITINILINEKKFKNNSLLMALSVNKILDHEIHLNKINSVTFRKFIELIITKHKLEGYTFVFDNVFSIKIRKH